MNIWPMYFQKAWNILLGKLAYQQVICVQLEEYFFGSPGHKLFA